jgi:hypothetical protein
MKISKGIVTWAVMTLVWLVFLLVLGACHASFASEALPTFIYVVFGLILLSRAEMPSWWDEYRDIAITSAVLIVVTIGGLEFVWRQAECPARSFVPCAGFSAMLWAIACLAAGFAVGFVFGIPRVLQPGDSAKTDSTPAGGNGQASYAQKVNTNLEQISDWLTKIIVGVGLVELKSLPPYLHTASVWMAQSFCKPDGDGFSYAASFSTSIIIYFCVVGFLAGYLITRLFFAAAFGRADSKNNIGLSLASFVSGGKFEEQRNQAITELKIP